MVSTSPAFVPGGISITHESTLFDGLAKRLEASMVSCSLVCFLMTTDK